MSTVLTLIRADRVFVSVLPDEVTGKHWIVDTNSAGANRRLASVEALGDKWVIYSHDKAVLVAPDGRKVPSTPLLPDAGLYYLKAPNEAYSALLVEIPTEQDKTFRKLRFSRDIDVTIGRASDNLFELAEDIVSSHHALLRFSNGGFHVADLKSANGVFVNGKAISKDALMPLAIGDVVFIFGLKIVIGKRFIAYNNPGGRLTVKTHLAFIEYRPQVIPSEPPTPFVEPQSHYFYRSPRIKRDIEEKSFEIEEPPAPTVTEETPLLLRIGPSVGMALASVFMALYMVLMLANGSGSWLRLIPMLAMVVVMILGAILWPNLNARYTRKKNAAKEKRREESYSAYLNKVRTSIADEVELQKQVLIENRISIAECFDRATKCDRRLFERTATQSDFLSLRLGIGDEPLAATFRWPRERIALEDDALKAEAVKLSQQSYTVPGVPLVLSLLTDYVSGVVGRRTTAYSFLRGLIVQIATLHAPDEVKIVLLCNERERAEWEFAFFLPHVFDDTFSVRYVATNPDDAAELSLRLEREMRQRLTMRAEVISDYGAYYVVLALDHELASKTAVLSKLAALRENRGFSLLSYARNIQNLPKECSRIVHIDTLQDGQGVLYSELFNPNDPTGTKTPFFPDIAVGTIDAEYFTTLLTRVELPKSDAVVELPKSLGFLDLFEAAKVEHLNVVSRWQDNNPCISLAAPIGIDASGAVSILNIHEDFHGPHGLIAGMTGSGKSEFIIAYVLSLAINYRPDEVSFVLIDYKGGGLAGAFDNDRYRLPHLAGTITNLDGAAITRSLISINSELRRRQDTFNQARDVSGLGTMDIYKYQELYRRGVVSKPVPHLLIISDEFAELKAQEPDFMNQLISAARIGRSLGVHLILATQKPSGVVNDQIWSNARFKVCLKVAEPADSREMLKTDDAAELVDPGRYYLQVGYNEYYALGQSCYAGAMYRPTEYFAKQRDNSVTLISNTGRGLLGIKPEPKGLQASSMPESVAVLEHLVQVAQDEQLTAPALWLDPIPEVITVDELLEKYCHSEDDAPKDPLILNPVIGELDDPGNQRKALLTLPLSQEGNAIIYGSTGSGKASLVSALLYSLLKTHTARELNAYLLDFGAETLGAFWGAPQVGDVVFTGDDEKIENLFRMLFGELERRRKLIAESGGSFLVCARQSIDPLPSILVVINSFEVFSELHEQHLNKLVTLSRDGIRCGIIFLLTCSRTAGILTRLASNFKQKLALKLNNADEYANVIGSVQGVVVPNAYERGLVRLDALYEFQGACLSANSDEREAIQALIKELHDAELDEAAATEAGTGTESGKAYRAPAIPSLPKHVDTDALHELGAVVRRGSIPVGVHKEHVSVVSFDFTRLPVMMVLSENEELEVRFLRGLIEVLASQETFSTIVLDCGRLLEGDCDVADATDAAGAADAARDAAGEYGHGVRVLQSREEVNSFAEDLVKNELPENSFVVIASLKNFVDALDGAVRPDLEVYLRDGGYRSLTGLVVSGEPSRFSSFNYDMWFKELSSYNSGIWLGSGINDQRIVKPSRILPLTIATPPKGFAWHVDRGESTLIKYVRSRNDRKEEF
ncbi:MAG: type VII secretion protein EssC [Coriobacteriales bacterium]|jgi:S-DNA-T family DNA segregation ATPase FtsK/SpoIIIE|nr:type VII secretion protein EssC [Coriobacteriales bacterium]